MTTARPEVWPARFTALSSPKQERGWDRLENGDLLKAAEEAGFEVLVTPDQNIRYQQNLAAHKIALVVLGKGRWTLVKNYFAQNCRCR